MAQTQGSGRSDHGKPPARDTPPSHPWDQFLIGPENELAFASAQALAQGQQTAISPLVVHGPSGVGKSRLLAGLVAEWVRRQSSTAVAHIQASEFAAACLDAVRQAEPEGWSAVRTRFRTVDLLAIDDVEEIGKISLARNELIHTLDDLESRGARVVVSSRTTPSQWPRRTWPVRLVSRLAGGLTVKIDPPSITSRRRYILEAARTRKLKLSAEAIEALADQGDNYRILDGWLTLLALNVRVARPSSPKPTHSSSNQRTDLLIQMDLAAVTRVLSEETVLGSDPIVIEQITRAIAQRFGIRPAALRGPSRQASVVEARQLAMHLARLHTRLSFAAIGDYFGGRDPTTVRHACKTATLRLTTNPALAAAVASLPGINR
jgi:chromosomal replication initiator protein